MLCEACSVWIQTLSHTVKSPGTLTWKLKLVTAIFSLFRATFAHTETDGGGTVMVNWWGFLFNTYYCVMLYCFVIIVEVTTYTHTPAYPHMHRNHHYRVWAIQNRAQQERGSHYQSVRWHLTRCRIRPQASDHNTNSDRRGAKFTGFNHGCGHIVDCISLFHRHSLMWSLIFIQWVLASVIFDTK